MLCGYTLQTTSATGHPERLYCPLTRSRTSSTEVGLLCVKTLSGDVADTRGCAKVWVNGWARVCALLKGVGDVCSVLCICSR